MSRPPRIPASRLWLVLAKAYGSIAAYVEQRIEAEGLCLSDFMVLEALLHRGPLPISAIGEKVLLASASMTSAIDRLEQRNFVQRHASSEDRRLRVVALTPQGKVFVTELFAKHAADLEILTSAFSSAEMKSLHDGLRTLGLAAKDATA